MLGAFIFMCMGLFCNSLSAAAANPFDAASADEFVAIVLEELAAVTTHSSEMVTALIDDAKIGVSLDSFYGRHDDLSRGTAAGMLTQFAAALRGNDERGFLEWFDGKMSKKECIRVIVGNALANFRPYRSHVAVLFHRLASERSDFLSSIVGRYDLLASLQSDTGPQRSFTGDAPRENLEELYGTPLVLPRVPVRYRRSQVRPAALSAVGRSLEQDAREKRAGVFGITARSVEVITGAPVEGGAGGGFPVARVLVVPTGAAAAGRADEEVAGAGGGESSSAASGSASGEVSAEEEGGGAAPASASAVPAAHGSTAVRGLRRRHPGAAAGGANNVRRYVLVIVRILDALKSRKPIQFAEACALLAEHGVVDRSEGRLRDLPESVLEELADKIGEML